MRLLTKKTVFLLLITTAFSCATTTPKHPVKVEKATAQSWTTAGENRRGTRVDVILNGAINEVKILGIVFNKLQLVPTSEVKEGKLWLLADFEKGIEKVFSEPVPSNKEDCIIYSYKGKIYELPIDNIKRKPAVYYPVK